MEPMHLARLGVAVDPRLAFQRTVPMVPTKTVEMLLPVVVMVVMEGMVVSFRLGMEVTSLPGGGGGGAEEVTLSGDGNGGNGGDGRVVLTYTPCVGPTVSVTPGSPSICSGGSVLLTASGASAGYTWSPATGLSSTSGATVTANPTSTTTYTVIGLNTGCGASGSTTVTVIVTPGPTAVTANSSASTVCTGGPVNLTGGATNLSSTILTNDFNSGLGTWNTTNNSSGGTPALADWTPRPDGYNVSSNTFHSNDNSQFFLSNSDAQGSGGTTETILSTPSFSTQGYSTLSLSYYHFFRYNSGTDDRARVEVSTNDKFLDDPSNPFFHARERRRFLERHGEPERLHQPTYAMGAVPVQWFLGLVVGR